MNTNLIVTTLKSEMHSLAYGGFLAYENFHQITGALTPEQALFFAEPILHSNGRSIDWYTPIEGTVSKLANLPEREQSSARAALAEVAKQISERAAAIKDSPAPSQSARGHLLELALLYPHENCLYAVNGHPVITCWGFGPGTPGAQPESLERVGNNNAAPAPAVSQTAPAQAAERVAPVPVSHVTRAWWLWLLWLFPLLLLLALFFLLTTSFGGSKPLIPGFDFKGPSLPFMTQDPDATKKRLQILDEERDKLNADIQALHAKLATLAAQCQEPSPVPSPAPSPEPSQGSPLVITQPDPSRPDCPMEFLRGRWSCNMGLVNKQNLQPITVLYEFDCYGKGTATVKEQGRGDCVGTAEAIAHDDGTLVINSAKQICSDGQSYAAEQIECRPGVNNIAMCLGKTAAHTDWGGSVPFYRVK